MVTGTSIQSEVSLFKLLKLWAAIGIQSFGGGPSTQFFIFRTFVEKYHWLSEEEYLRYWAMCGIVPGVNLLALCVLIGRKLGGVKGIVVSMLALMLPSAAITLLLTVVFLGIQNLPAVQAMLKGVVPATSGLMLLIGIKTARPLLKKSRAEGWLSLLVACFVITLCVALILLVKVQVFILLVGMGFFGAIVLPLFSKEKVKKP